MIPFLTKRMQELAPRIITKRDIIRKVPGNWRRQYPEDRVEITSALDALDLETATAADIAKIIGNDSWTSLDCDICEQDCEAVVSVPREYEGPHAVCRDCAAGIVQMFDAVPQADAQNTPDGDPHVL